MTSILEYMQQEGLQSPYRAGKHRLPNWKVLEIKQTIVDNSNKNISEITRICGVSRIT